MTEGLPIEAIRAWVWQCSGITASQRLVLLALCEQLHRGHPCQCSLRELATLVALTPRGLTKVLARLDGRYLRRERRGRGYPTQYSLLCPLLEAPATDRQSRAQEGASVDPAPLFAPTDRLPQCAPPSADERSSVAPAPTTLQKAQHLTLVETRGSVRAARSSGASAPSPSGPASPHHRARAAPIAPAWTPGETVYAWAHKRGLERAWVQAQVDEFVIYWRDCGESRKSWDATCCFPS